jgi:transposase
MKPSSPDRPVAPDGRHIVGIDVGKQTHSAVGLTPAGQTVSAPLTFDNDRAGIDRLENRLLKPCGGPAAVLLAMEATGHYWMPLYYELLRRGYGPIVLNPLQTRAKFQTRLRKTKTDPLDALAIARLVLAGEARPARIPDEPTLELRLLARHRWRLVDLASDLERFALTLIDRLFPEYQTHFSKPFLPTGRALIREIGLAPAALLAEADAVPDLLRTASRGHFDRADAQRLLARARHSIGIGCAEPVLVTQLQQTLDLIETVEAQTDALDDELSRRVERLDSPLGSLGLKAPLVATIHAESDPITDFRHPGQYAAFAGLDPSTSQSGQMTSSHAHLSKRGSPHLRRALFLAAAALYRRHADLRRCYTRHRTKGHHHTDALVIVAHKLARIIWRLLTDHRPFRARPPKPKKDA